MVLSEEISKKSKTACNGDLKLDTLDVVEIDFKFTIV